MSFQLQPKSARWMMMMWRTRQLVWPSAERIA